VPASRAAICCRGLTADRGEIAHPRRCRADDRQGQDGAVCIRVPAVAIAARDLQGGDPVTGLTPNLGEVAGGIDVVAAHRQRQDGGRSHRGVQEVATPLVRSSAAMLLRGLPRSVLKPPPA